MEDERLANINQQKETAINNSNNVYNGLLQDNQNQYNTQLDNLKEQEKIQNDLLDKQFVFNEQKINHQKEVALQNKDNENRKAMNDYMGEINRYGVNAENQASMGLSNSGMSETSRLGYYNTYQNRLANNNRVTQEAITQYDMEMNQAKLTNDTNKAQNALNKLQMILEYNKEYNNNKMNLTQTQLSINQKLDSDYFNRYQTEYNNIQTEKAREEAIRQWQAEMEEKQRQYNENMAWQKEQQRIQQEQWAKQYALSQYQAQTARQKAAQSQNQNTPSLDDTSDKRNIDNSQVTANMTPYFNTSAGKEWFDNNFSNSMSKNELVSTVARGISLGQISDVEADRIYDCYGLK